WPAPGPALERRPPIQPEVGMDELDRILSSDRTITPSRDFTFAVMQAVERQAASPSLILFPWRHLLSGVASILVAAGGIFWFTVTPALRAGPILQALSSPISLALIGGGAVLLASLWSINAAVRYTTR